MFPGKYLIVNADDFNLTRGVDQAILECHDQGIVSSTTVLVTLPTSRASRSALKARTFLGKGLHLSLTLGQAAHPKTPFHLTRALLGHLNKIPEPIVEREFDAQIQRFEKWLGQRPTHFDTHHHIHANPSILSAVRCLSRKYRVPFRHNKPPLHLFEDMDPRRHWTRVKFLRCLTRLPFGISEIMVHPGYVDGELREISSFVEGRETERKLLADKRLGLVLDELNIKLIHFGDLPYFAPLFAPTRCADIC